MNEGREYKYQADWSLGNQMFHVRCDDWEAFKEAKENMETLLPSNKPFPDDTVGKPVATTPEKAMNAPICEDHHLPMTWHPAGVSKKTGKPYNGFWSCKVLNEDGSYCTFKPAKV